MINHLSLGTKNLQNAGRFYDATFDALGYVRLWTKGTAIGYGIEGSIDTLASIRRTKPVLADWGR